ncbi:DUF1302 domain-containing protein [Pseudomonas sp. UL073]|uniref:DUF1302 domain-containing protein n=1 Tax=Zestomonas insulae TaxID=2809017 RepID=A0ABS2IC35_9GAMM|nr:DUF1302 domain-containing protein [Pseudomonas insulae]MBM7060671.1 DUF1302 domain-containing protein [Pseudomonas insulae]
MYLSAKSAGFQASALTLALCSVMVGKANAFTFNYGELEGQFDSSLSIGASWAASGPDKHLIGANNGGKASSTTSDDGRLNFKKGETFSKIFKGVHDLELRYQNYGFFARGKYWYDFELKDESRPFKDIDDSNRKRGAQASGAELLDMFAYYNYEVGDMAGSFRVGKQVVSWGESTFIGGGINSINPVDISALRRPGSELKEGLIPVEMLYLTQSLTENTSMELFYQLDWKQVVLDNCGTYFGIDNMADGCEANTVSANLTGNPAAVAALTPEGIDLTPEGIRIQRAGDNDARNSGQWGAALRWNSLLLDTEFAAYFMNYHSRMPYYSMITGPHTADFGFAGNLCANAGVSGAACSGLANALGGAYRLGTSKYFADYPEDIRLYGLSFATTLATGTAIQGELSYRPNAPLQINGTDMTLAMLGTPSVSPVYSSGLYGVANNQTISGYQRKEMTQLQGGATHIFNQVAGADRLILIGEAAIVHTGGLDNKYGLRFGRDGAFGQGVLADNALCRTSTNTTNPQYCNDEGFTTATAWGYRLRGTLDYRDVLPQLNLRPSLAFSHDVKGYGPSISPFIEGSKAVSLGVDADLRSFYTASLSYTNYFDGKYNTQVDRDFVALSFGVNF